MSQLTKALAGAFSRKFTRSAMAIILGTVVVLAGCEKKSGTSAQDENKSAAAASSPSIAEARAIAINSPMLPKLNRDADGGLTLLIQNESPGKDKEANWLPAPKGPFAMYMRLYWPKGRSVGWKVDCAAVTAVAIRDSCSSRNS